VFLRPLAAGLLAPGLLAPVLLAVLLAACAPAGKPPAPAAPLPDLAPYRTFVVPAPLAPFAAQGAVAFSYRGERESGDLLLQALPGAAFRLELRSPLTGGVALEVWLLPARLRVIDYVNETWLLAENTPEVRRRLFAVDLAPADLQTLFTGRVEQARFERGAGALSPARDEAAFRDGDALHRFRLDPHGLPAEWVKEGPGGRVFRVEFREYLALPEGVAEPLRLPRKVRLYGADGEPLLVLGLHTVRLGLTPDGAADAPPPLDALPPAARDFAPVRLP
jgi:hypothetical protein